jgi:hypothetical protein
MSQETIVNRVSQTAPFEAEGRALADVPVVPVVPVFEELPARAATGYIVEPGKASEVFQWGAAESSKITHIDESVGQTEDPDDNIGNLASTSSIGAAHVLLGSISSDVEFKQQVIAAFKHLGLDVRKHFGV